MHDFLGGDLGKVARAERDALEHIPNALPSWEYRFLNGAGCGACVSAGETVWRELDAGYFILDTYSHIHHQHGWSGNINRSYEVTDKRWTNHGVLRWRVTDQRLASRSADGELISIYWVALGGCQIDLDAECVILDSHNRTRYCLTGPAVPVIAVAAVASPARHPRTHRPSPPGAATGDAQ